MTNGGQDFAGQEGLFLFFPINLSRKAWIYYIIMRRVQRFVTSRGDLRVTGDLSSFIVIPLTCELNILSVSKAARWTASSAICCSRA